MRYKNNKTGIIIFICIVSLQEEIQAFMDFENEISTKKKKVVEKRFRYIYLLSCKRPKGFGKGKN